jgi:hypothetical protein
VGRDDRLSWRTSETRIVCMAKRRSRGYEGLANLDLVLSSPMPQPRSGGVAANKAVNFTVARRYWSPCPSAARLPNTHDHEDEKRTDDDAF